MAAFNKFQDFVEQVAKGVHQLHAAGHTLKVYLSNELPLATDTIKANIADIAAEHGYPAGGSDIQNDISEAAGVAKMTGVDVVFTASGGSFGPFQYVIIYNDSAVSPEDALVAWWDYGSAITVNDTEAFTVDFDATNGILQLT
jgi:hypothetical protein